MYVNEAVAVPGQYGKTCRLCRNVGKLSKGKGIPLGVNQVNVLRDRSGYV